MKLDDQAPVESRTGAGAGAAGGAGGANSAGSSQTRVAPVDVTGTSNVNCSNLPRDRLLRLRQLRRQGRLPAGDRGQRQGADRRTARCKMAVEGHTDERGGREYNLALGQKRAEAVAKSLTLLGATDTRSRR